MLRLTKINRCGLPIEGASHRLVTEGFIRVSLDPELRAASNIEQNNAAGNNCILKRRPPERLWWNVEAQFCGVDPDAFSMITGWARVLDADDKPIGVRDRATVETTTGVAFEIWTGTGEGDGCVEPTDDSIFSAPVDQEVLGYLLFGGTEFIASGFAVEDGAATFTLRGRTIAMPQWGRGPYNVAAIDSSGTAGRLLSPTSTEEHITLFTTPVPPPEVTDGAVALSVQSIFTNGTAYFGASAADVAPAQTP